MALQQEIQIANEQSAERTLEILKTIKELDVPLENRLNHYCSILENEAKALNLSSEELVNRAESNLLDFDLATEVLKIATLIKRHKIA